MVNFGLLVTLESKRGKAAEVESFLRNGLELVKEEPATVTWFALRLGPTTFGIFDAFVDEEARRAHLMGRFATALMARMPELLAGPPRIEDVDVLAVRFPC